ncbi:MAG: HAD-IIIC family phosphatase [Candidatus Paceibacterota bacterium]|jgi:FkbH-like protein
MKKCVVLDLDNTLWGGVVGEEGIDAIALSLTPPGASFIAFQQALRDLHDRGVILAINSSNNPEDALAVIRTHPNMILKESHFAAQRINWNDKVANMRELATELNIGLDSMVFFDDSPLNREAMRTFLPEVETPELPADPTQYARFLHTLPYFNAEAITDEDKMRGNMYVTERLRKEAEKQFENREAFLKSLGIELTVYENDLSSLTRLAQLTEKTNQFNVKKRPLSEQEIETFMRDGSYTVFHARAIDQFGDQGIIAFALVHKENKQWNIDSLLISCRVVGRGIEDAFLAAIAKRAGEEGAHTISITFEPSEKNELARSFVERIFKNSSTVPVGQFRMPDWITLV